jgi:hypothetical protein
MVKIPVSTGLMAIQFFREAEYPSPGEVSRNRVHVKFGI